MKIRAALDLNGRSEIVSFFSILQETEEHLLLKLAGSLFFFDENPIIINAPQQHEALLGQEFAPDLLAVTEGGQVRLWIECGKTTPHKLEKVLKRFRDARMVVLTSSRREGQQMAETLGKLDLNRFEVWSFRDREFPKWRRLVTESNTIIGEASSTELNLVINDEVYMTELERMTVGGRTTRNLKSNT